MNEAMAITGLGVISAAGSGVEASLATLGAGIRPSLVPCPVGDFPIVLPMYVAAGDLPAGDRTFRLALVAARQALREAGLETLPEGFRLGVCLGTTVACQLNDLAFYAAYRTTGNPPLEAVERFSEGGLAERVARELGADGPVMTVVNACSSGNDAFGVALAWLRTGRCEAVVAGGADELSAIPASGFFALGVTSPDPCRPFDKNRQGLNLGEGAGAAVLERPESAARRGRKSRLSVAGFGGAADGHHLTAPHPDGLGLELAVRAALDDAGIGSECIDFINAHGTATRENDRIEGGVLARLFGRFARVVSTKGYTGHTLGAAGGIEAVFTALALREGWIPSNIGFADPDEAIPVVPLTAVTPVVRSHALSTSLAFGGNNAALVIARTEAWL
jgi:3-oxoacyl-(acyl-carrier-protein) synthase